MKFFLLNQRIWLITIPVIVFTLLRFPSLVEPNWYGDEGIYQVLGQAIAQGKTLYVDVWDNKPPLLYYIYAIGQGNLFFAKLMSLLAGMLSVVAFYFLAKEIFRYKKSIILSVSVFSILFGLPVIEGNIANAENFMLLPSILSALFVLKFAKFPSSGNILKSGFILSISLAIKIVAVFDFAAFLIFLLISKKHLYRSRYLLYFVFSFLSLLAVFSVFFMSQGYFREFVESIFLMNVSYVEAENTFIFPMGILFVKTVLLLFGMVAIFYFKDKLSRTALFIFIWVIFGLYNAFFSDRPYTHYLLVLLSAFSLLIGHIAESKKERVVVVASVIAICLIAYFHFRIYRKNLEYYQNFFSFITYQKTIDDYQAFFDNNTPRDYAISEFITTNVKRDSDVFLWSDSAQIYIMSDILPISKYIVSYHARQYDINNLTISAIEQNDPQFIISTTEDDIIDKLSNSYQLRYIINGARIYERQI